MQSLKPNSKYIKALKAAFPHTIPIFAGFWFLGLTYGIYMHVSGFSFWYPMLMSLTWRSDSILTDRCLRRDLSKECSIISGKNDHTI